MKQSWQGIIDTSMYKSMQQFRIAGCCKHETSRFKVISKELTVNGITKSSKGWIPKIEPESENHKVLLLIEASLITQVSGSQMLPALLDDKEQSSEFLKSGERKEYSEFFEPLSSENIKEALTLCYKVAGLEYGDSRFPYSYMRTVEDNGESSIILLKRRFASMCRICNRPHENENPFLIIAGIEREIYLDCRRNEKGKKFYVGKLGPSEKGKTLIVKTIQSFEEKESIPEGPKILIKIPGAPELKNAEKQSMEINITDITKNLATISQKVAPKIKMKDSKPIDKESVKLNFKL
jgi:hypothetical protein